MGPYCRYCDHRCFVERVVPAGPKKGWRGLMATCPRGMEHDRKATGGYDHASSINPRADVLMPAGDGTHRVIEADALRALVGYVEQRDA